MRHSHVIRRLTPPEWSSYRDLRLRALAESPDAFGSTLELEGARADAEWERRLMAGANSPSDLPLVAWLGDEMIGLAWGWLRATEPEVASLSQVWVAPEHRGRGVARMLLDAVVAWAREAGARYLVLDVTCGDTAARRLYVRAGFDPWGDPEPLRPGSRLLKQRMRLALRR